jgi:hypothetical protein
VSQVSNTESPLSLELLLFAFRDIPIVNHSQHVLPHSAMIVLIESVLDLDHSPWSSKYRCDNPAIHSSNCPALFLLDHAFFALIEAAWADMAALGCIQVSLEFDPGGANPHCAAVRR